MLPDWFGVPSDVLELISKRLLSWDDYVRFRSVCTSWRSAAPKRPHLPLLVVKNSRSVISPCLEICNFPSTELYTPQQMPEGIAKHSSRGCSRGWLCSISSQNCRSTIYLHNPFTGAQISLPVMPYQAIPTKVVLSSDPILDPHNCVVMAKCSNPLVFHCSPGDASWTPSLEDFPDSSRDYIDDIIFYKGNSYAVSSFDRFFVSRLGPHDARFTEILPVDILPPVDINILTERFLVVSSGDLFMVVLTYTYEDKVSEFQVFKFDLDCGRLRLFKQKNLGGCAFFLSPWSMSLSLSVNASSSSHTCRENCIYFAGRDPMVVVFNMEDNSISFLTDVCWPFKFWLTPSLYD